MTTNSTLQATVLENANGILAKQVLEELIAQGVQEFCLCPGGRMAPLLYPLVNSLQVHIYNWPEERSAAFFALGRIKATGRPTAVVTTSGTAAAELLPAAMEAYYTGLPLVLITADRPRRFRGTGAPQAAEQVGLFGCYAHEMYDLAQNEELRLNDWTQCGPLHLNVCFEEPKDSDCQMIRLDPCLVNSPRPSALKFTMDDRYVSFLQRAKCPFIIVGALDPSQHESAVRFLLHLKAPVYAEGISGIREDHRLAHLRITHIENVWSCAEKNGYPIDGILRIGGVPTARLWRDLEHAKYQKLVCSISENPFSGLSCADVIHTSLRDFFSWAQTIDISINESFQKWKIADHAAFQALETLFQNEPQSEQGMIHALSKKIPKKSKVYLGNSLPIREWDQAATYESRKFQMSCSRGVNGIDGQLATFLGYSSPEQENWSILGDLTILYDLVAPWISSQLTNISANVVIVNNGGSGMFKRMFAHPAFRSTHQLDFESFARFWGWRYEKWDVIPQSSISLLEGGRLIEILPNPQATERVWQRVKEIER